MEHIPKYLQNIKHTEKTIYRGHADCGWELKPSIGRHFTGAWSTVLQWELRSLDEFKKQAIPYLKTKPVTDIDWLCLMQHHGCATRLLDFTSNPLIALFFASDPGINKDGEVIIAQYGRTYSNVNDDKLFNRTHNFTYYPPHITERIIGQSGCFVYASEPNRQLKGKQIRKMPVVKKNKIAIRRELENLGIKNSSLFPGMDGVCQDLNLKLILDLEFDEIFESV